MSFLSQPLSIISLFTGPSRSFSGISGYVTMTENTTDTLEITQHPVQQGAMISDHAFKKPVSLSIQMLFSDNLTTSLSDIYQSLLNLQIPQVQAPTSLLPGIFGPPPAAGPAVLSVFDVVTPKRVYHNMLLQTLGQTTDKRTENCLAINATFLEVIIVPVAITLVPRSSLQNPGSNGGTQGAGKKSALKVLIG